MSKSLIIDPGHGGSDTGAIGFGIKEKDWNLKISLYQYHRLKDLGANVAITRTTDEELNSSKRTALIKNKFDYCMSNHFNAFNGTARGVETIYSIYSDDDIATKLANAIVGISKLPLRRVFARKGNNGDYYFMHRQTGTTQTTIVEYGFIDNKQDYNYYANDDNFYAVAEKVVEVWCEILNINYVEPNEQSKQTDKTNKTILQMAIEVERGIHGIGHENRRRSLGVTDAVYQEVRREVNRRAGAIVKPTPKPTKTILQMAKEIEKGIHGIGHEKRRKSLGINQTEYERVRSLVNERAGIKKPKLKSIDVIAKEVKAGKWGNGTERRKLLESAGYSYRKVQTEVNKLFK